MSYHKSWFKAIRIVFWTVLAMLLAGCGGGGFSLTSLSSGASQGAAEHSQQLVNAPKFTYSYAQYPDVDGLTVVPMEEENCPAPVGTGDYSLSVVQKGDSATATLSAGPNTQKLLASSLIPGP
jgi:hypothetical protein